MANADGYIVWYNRRWYDYTGTTPAEMEGWGWTSVHDPETLPSVMEGWTGAVARGEPFEMTFPLRGADGVFRPFLTRVEPFADEAGQVTRWFGLNTDVSARQAAEVALRESEARLNFLDALAEETARLSDADAILTTTTRLVGEHLGVCVCAYADMDEDQDGFTIRGDWSAPGSASIVGHYSLAAFGKLAVATLGAGLPLVVNDNLQELAPEEAATFRSIGIAATICMPLVRAGRLTALMAIHDKAPRRWSPSELALIQDVTARSWAHVERVGAAAELRASEENLQSLARAIPNHVWTSLPNGDLDWFNEQVMAYSGLPLEKLTGRGWASIVHPEDIAAAAERWAEALASGSTYQVEFRLQRADGAWRWHIARAVPIKGESGQVTRWIGTNTDIEEQKEAAGALSDLNATLERRVDERTAELVQAQEGLRQAQKMEAVGQLTGGVAHDFNNLLTIISGNLELLHRRLPEDAGRLRRSAENALQGAKRAATLTQRLLAFSRRQPLQPKPLSVNQVVTGMSDMLSRTLGEEVEVQTVVSGGLWLVEADPAELESTLLNLAVNARDAMPGGGKLTIETANAHLDEAYAGTQAEVSPGQYVMISVSDTGTGMTRDVLERVFEPFFTTKEVGQGTGLGLSQVYGFVKQSGGHVKAYSELGKGTSLKVYLPRLHDGVEPDEAPLGTSVPEGTGEETILVVEDDHEVRAYSVEVLLDLGYRVIEAADGLAALRLLQTGQHVDVLFTDVVLPGGMTGRVLADGARQLRPGLKVLYTSGYSRNAIVHQGRLDPGVQLISKPFTYSDLATRVRDVLDSGG